MGSEFPNHYAVSFRILESDAAIVRKAKEIAPKAQSAGSGLYPHSAADFDSVEVAACREDDDGVEVTYKEDDISFWSVYLHFREGGVVCIEDYPTKVAALENAILLMVWLRQQGGGDHAIFLNYPGRES